MIVPSGPIHTRATVAVDLTVIEGPNPAHLYTQTLKEVSSGLHLANLRAVRDLFAHADPIPADLWERMKFALTVQALHAEVAELMDSALQTTRSAYISAEPTPVESVTFTAANVSLMVSVVPAELPERVRVDGWVTVPGSTVDAVTAESTTSAVSDANGRFVLDDLPHGPIHFVIFTDPANKEIRPVITPTIQI